jgi:hypothetical protein
LFFLTLNIQKMKKANAVAAATPKTAKQVINAKVAAAKAAAAGKTAKAAPAAAAATKRTKTVIDPQRVALAEKAIEQHFAAGEAENTCNTIKFLTRAGFKPLEIIAATGFNKVTVYRQSAEATVAANFSETIDE